VTKGPLELLARVVAMLDSLAIPYALGGSLASSFLGEPRSTVDVDLAVQVDDLPAGSLLESCMVDFVVRADDAFFTTRKSDIVTAITTQHPRVPRSGRSSRVLDHRISSNRLSGRMTALELS
jgi:hypothetical protein